MLTEKEAQQLEKLRNKMAQMKAQEKTIIAREKDRQRKVRTRRLIQLGALAEKYLNCCGIMPAEFETLLQKIINKGAVDE